MCGRITITLPTDAMAQLFAATPANYLPKVPNYNVCPTTQVHVVRAGVSGRALVSMRWGLVPKWYDKPSGGPLLINVRAETIAEKPAFRAACRERRCLIPATGYYEWTKDDACVRYPWYFTRADGGTINLAGIWQDWGQDGERISTCAVVTTNANKATSAVHHRMPVVLEDADIGKWLGEAGTGAATLMQAAPEDALKFHRVDRAVNSNRASGPELIEPFKE